MIDNEDFQIPRITFSQKEVLFIFEVESVLSNFMTDIDIIRPLTRLLNWDKDFKRDQIKYNEQITKKFLEAIKPRK